ncbi:hypothetical protein CVS40_10208 [Lucilia cuprina]|nr:hypothetical protein CVS40_10208 [Lucilia cuprina]
MDDSMNMSLVPREECMNAIIKPVNMIDNSTAVSFQKNPIITTTSSTPTNVNSNTQHLTNTSHLQQQQQQQQQPQQQHNQLPLQPVNFVGNNLKNGTLSYGLTTSSFLPFDLISTPLREYSVKAF